MKRIACVLLIAATAAAATAAMATGTTSHRASSGPAAGVATVVPPVGLLGLFGNENEPDENEPNESGPNGQPSTTGSQSHGGSSSSPPLKYVLPAVGVGLALLIGVTMLIVRWVRRYRAWKRRVTFRARASMRRLGDDVEQARRRAFRPRP
jgi:hypothetical protein